MAESYVNQLSHDKGTRSKETLYLQLRGAYWQGANLSEIAEAVGVSKERVRQVVQSSFFIEAYKVIANGIASIEPGGKHQKKTLTSNRYKPIICT